MTFAISSHECSYSPLKLRIWCSNPEPFCMLLPLLRHAVPLTAGVVASQCPSSKDAALMMRFFTPLLSACINPSKRSSTIKCICNESANIIASCNVAFDTNDCWNTPKTVPVNCIWSIVTRTRLRYSREFLTPGICSLIKYAAKEKQIVAISRQNPHIHVIMSYKTLYKYLESTLPALASF